MSSAITQCIDRHPTRKTIVFAGIPINLTELCKRTGVTYSYLSLILNGRKTPSITIARRIAEGLGLGLGEFIGYQEIQKPRQKRPRRAPKKKAA